MAYYVAVYIFQLVDRYYYNYNDCEITKGWYLYVFTVSFVKTHKALSAFVVLDGKTSKDSVPLFTLLKQILTQRSFGN